MIGADPGVPGGIMQRGCLPVSKHFLITYLKVSTVTNRLGTPEK